MFRVKIHRYELWGNLKDGFDVNNVFLSRTLELDKRPSKYRLLSIVRDEFEGRGFALNESSNHYMRRQSIKFDSDYQNNVNSEMIYFAYKGQQIGYAEIQEVKDIPAHYLAVCMQSDAPFGHVAYRQEKRFEGTNFRKVLKEAKEHCNLTMRDTSLSAKMDRIEIHFYAKNAEYPTDTTEFEFRKRGTKFIGMPGDKCPFDGWYNLSK